MEFEFQNADNRIAELGNYYVASNSKFIKLLIQDCIDKTVKSTSIYAELSTVLTTLFKNILKSEEAFLTKSLENLRKIELINNDLSKSKELDKYTDDMKLFIVENEKDLKTISYLYVNLTKKLVQEILEERGDILFNQILKTNLSEFKKIALDKFSDKVIEKLVTLIPAFGELYDNIIFTYESLKALDIENSIKEMISEGEPIIIYLENYHSEISKFNNEVTAIIHGFKEYNFEKLRSFAINESLSNSNEN